jgi:hypothetical protein
MQESKLTNFQQRTLSESMKEGTSLPTDVGATSRITQKRQPAPPKRESKIVDPNTYKYGLRKYDEIKNSGAYEKSDYRPVYKSQFFFI